MSVIDRIKEEMQKKGFSQNRLAKAAQMSQSGLSSILNGNVSPKENTLRAIAEALNVPLSELMEDIQGQIYDEEQEDEAMTIRERLRRDPSYRLLFNAANKASPEHLRAAAAMLKALEPGDDDG